MENKKGHQEIMLEKTLNEKNKIEKMEFLLGFLKEMIKLEKKKQKAIEETKSCWEEPGFGKRGRGITKRINTERIYESYNSNKDYFYLILEKLKWYL